MEIRRVVTGTDDAGKARFMADDFVKPRMAAMLPGLQMFYVWGADETQRAPNDGTQPAWTNHFPESDGFRATVCVLPPAQVAGHEGQLTEAEIAEAEAAFPGLLATFDKENPGVHTSTTVDVAFLISGTVDLELEDGEIRHLKPGDIVIQNGTPHKWTNTGGSDSKIVFILIGANQNV